MKLSRSKCLIVGAQAGEISAKLLGGQIILQAKFAIVTESGEAAGYFEKAGSWSERTQELLKQLSESLETDALPHIFEEPIEDGLPVDSTFEEPPQI